jgi:ornithine carbamoyltransferase
LGYAAVELQQGFKGRHILDFSSISREELASLLALAEDLKVRRDHGESTPYLQGKTLAMIFEKASTRTRVSFEVAMFELGGHALFLSDSATQIGRGESVPDTARVLSRYVHGIMIRTFAHEKVVELANYATVPVINGLTDDHHPCQVMADLFTIAQHKGSLQGLTITYVGDGNNMAHSILQSAPMVGMNVRIATPIGYEPKAEIVAQAKEYAKVANTEVWIGHDPTEAVAGADAVYTDVWASMGQEQEAEARKQAFMPYQVNLQLMSHAAQDALFLHCLPAHRGEEVTAQVIDSPASVVFDQVENRLHVQKALLVATMSDLWK